MPIKPSEQLCIREFPCNNTCRFCMSAGDIMKNNDYFDQKTIYETIKKKLITNRADYEEVDFFSGEPTILDKLPELMIFAYRIGYKKIHLATNCRRLSLKDYAEEVKRIPIYSIRTTFFTIDEKFHDNMTRRKGSFQQTTKGISNVVSFQDKLTGRFLVNIVILKQNVVYLKEIVIFLKRIGVTQIRFSGLINNIITDSKLFQCDFEKIKEQLPQIIDFCIKENLTVFIEKLPICTVPNYKEIFMLDKDKDLFRKDSKCTACIHFEECSGYPK